MFAPHTHAHTPTNVEIVLLYTNKFVPLYWDLWFIFYVSNTFDALKLCKEKYIVV